MKNILVSICEDTNSLYFISVTCYSERDEIPKNMTVKYVPALNTHTVYSGSTIYILYVYTKNVQ